MNGKQLKNSILQWAIQGKLVPQDPNDEPASVLLERIRKEKEQLVKEKKIKKDKNASIIFRGEDNSYYEKFLATGEVKCIDEEIPFEIPENWCWVRLGQILTVKGGKRIPLGDSFASSPTTHIYIRVTEMKNHTLIDTNLKYISDAVYEKIKNYTISKNDLYLTIAGTIGAVGVVPEKFDGMNLTENAVKLTNIFVNKLFLVYGISSQFVQLQFVDKTKQMAQPKLAIERILTTLIPLPPLNEQESIVAKINEVIPLVDKYEKSQRILDLLNIEIFDRFKNSILQEAIQGKLVPQIVEEGTAQELLEQIKQEKQKLVKEGKLKKSALTDSVIFKGDDNKYYEQMGTKCIDISESIPFEVPIGWCWTRLSVISNLYTGNSISETEKATRYTNVQGMEYIGTKDVSFNHVVNYANGIAIPNEHISQFKIAPSRSVLLCIEGGSAGRKIAQIEKNVCFGNKLCCFVPYVMATSKYIYFYLQSPSFFENFRGNIAGIIGGVSVNTLKSLLIPLPPIKEQKRIVAQIEKLFEKLK